MITGLVLSGCQYSYTVNANKKSANAYKKNILIEVIDNTEENKEEIGNVIDYVVKRLYFDDKDLFTGISSKSIKWGEKLAREDCHDQRFWQNRYFSCIQRKSQYKKYCYSGTDTKITKINNSEFLVNYKFNIKYTRSCSKKTNDFSLLVYEENDKLLIYIKGKDQYMLRKVIIVALRKYKIARSYLPTYNSNLI